jgi:GrpB-like predicted nucleotidyltransferase (UPF0157 family)
MNKNLEQRIEDAVREEIEIVPYDQRWPQLFEDEAAYLRKKLPAPLIERIEHFGSTAVPGLPAKPIIDILVQVESLDRIQTMVVPLLEAEGYEFFWRTDTEPAYGWFIKRNAEGKRTHHIHMVEAESKLWERLYFRDYLREFSAEARHYAELKQSLAAKYPRDRIAYTAAKSAMVESITAAARSYYEMLERSKS